MGLSGGRVLESVRRSRRRGLSLKGTENRAGWRWLAGKEGRQRLVELLELHGLGKMGVEAGLQRVRHVLAEGIGRERDDMGMRPASGRSRTRMASVAWRPFISGMRMSMRMAS